MKTLARLRALSAVVGAMALASICLGASAAMGATSTNGNISVSADPWPPVASQPVTVTGTVMWNNVPGKYQFDCKTWSLTFDGETVNGDASNATTTSTQTTFQHVFTAPANAASRVNNAQATCVTENQLGYGLQNIDPNLASQVITAGSNGKLPNTGGPSLAWLIAGLLLIPTGTWMIVRGRKQTA